MKYALIVQLVIVAALVSGCSGDYSNKSDFALNGTSNEVVKTQTEATRINESENGNECRICDFDFDAYRGQLKKEEIEALLLALNDEYLAIATYDQVNKDLGSPRPFANIVNAESKHADLLKGLLTKYGVKVPENPWPGKVPKFSDLSTACAAGVEGEILNRDLYTRLFKTTEREDILQVYRSLQSASEENHLPAFERCGGEGRGPGNGRGKRGNQ